MCGVPYDSGVVLTTWAAGLDGSKIAGISFQLLGVSWPSYLRKALVETWCRPYPLDTPIPQDVTFPNWAATDRKRLSDTRAGRSAHAFEQPPLGLKGVLTETRLKISKRRVSGKSQNDFLLYIS